ncbi:hypothetical protein ACP8HI_25245 [Paenibacillus sp. FA6]|uniref:hypothetical protein n=1 Tax=Paenibacillus sp. FA6 TaxID=3413029 RepID=UPI003F658C2E
MTTMIEQITELEELTAALVQRIEQVDYEELTAFTERREQLVHQIGISQRVLTVEDKQRLRNLGEYDETILSKMSSLKLEASEWLLKQEAVKEQKNAYGAGYSVESMFIDDKK